ncbi:hypothetical protein SAMN05192560_1359 [Methylobacillus rhizosphaerae]|uniref:Antitoxin VbhA domain-containing protein n=1 Tax=Methylobacillus rhizosphaerae TaxID=551994 RepID=A0A238ZN05_9PROT|nr:antitoxin VbhA family protein [Methylobacillus rhizosphaerae]SNR84348.1 hypothetical protein SAMN05192560_1359 [Methylobacillus rhizosphaerae]
MSKEATMTIRVDTDLRSSFVAATKRNDRPASQVLRDFMRSYVELTTATASSQQAQAAPQVISQRRQASEAAIASVQLEGFDVPADTLAESERFIKGDIEFSELIARLYEQAGQ